MWAMYDCGGGALGGYLRRGSTGRMIFGMRDRGACIGRICCRGVYMGCHVTVLLGDGVLWRRTNRLWGHDVVAK